jgi:formylglycine-generating enzyme required for sulfatase activity
VAPDGATLGGDEGPLPPLTFLGPAQGSDELGRLGGYRLLRVLGRGGMGLVFAAEDVLMRRCVALKVMLPEVAKQPQARERFLREARAAGKLSHDHIIPVYHVGEDNGVPFLVMPLLKGETLEGRLRRERRLPLVEVVRLGREMAEGLAAAHADGLIHRDVKPANVWLEAPNGRVKLLDFGLARLATADRLTRSGGILGTPAYLAPEQASGQAEAGSDVFGLGVVLYEMLAGERPFDGPDLIAIVARILSQEPTPLRQVRPEVPPELAALVRRMLARTPQGRPGAAEVAERLRRMPVGGAGRPSQTMPAGPVAPPRRQRRRWSVTAVVGTLLVLLGVVAATGVVVWQAQRRAAARLTQGPDDKPGGEVRPQDEKQPRPQERGPLPPLPASFTNSIGMELKLIPPGKFLMGSPKGEGDEDEEPRHEVQISRPFYLGIYPVTQEEYRRVIGENPSSFSPQGDRKEQVAGMSTDRFPVENVSWHDAVAFCDKLSALRAERAAGLVYRLPTEAEWEYAYRAGTRTAFWWGDSASSARANFDGNFPSGGAARGENLQRTCRVGSYAANPWGLFDMGGNVYQWCSDWYDPDYYDKEDIKDPQGPGNGDPRDRRVLRGGSWALSGRYCRAAHRRRCESGYRYGDFGFRVAVSAARTP